MKILRALPFPASVLTLFGNASRNRLSAARAEEAGEAAGKK
jgi:hypothetical protein